MFRRSSRDLKKILIQVPLKIIKILRSFKFFLLLNYSLLKRCKSFLQRAFEKDFNPRKISEDIPVNEISGRSLLESHSSED